MFICQAGVGDPEVVNLHSVEGYAANLPQVEVVRNLGVLPPLDPRALSAEIQKEQLDRVVIAGDSPGYFKPAFTRAMATAGKDPDEVRLASFREHGADKLARQARSRSSPARSWACHSRWPPCPTPPPSAQGR